MAFRQANATLDSGFYNKIAELGISNFWDTIMKTIPWYNDNCTDPIKNVTEWLVTSHERYNKVHPYERMKHQYGMFATEVHKFSESLKRLHGDNQHIMECYFKCDKWDSEPEVSLGHVLNTEECNWKTECTNWKEGKEARNLTK